MAVCEIDVGMEQNSNGTAVEWHRSGMGDGMVKVDNM